MKSRRVKLLFSLALAMTMLFSACNLIPSSFEIETTSELGPNTLGRI
jgi:hypothetical protein